MNRHQKCNKQIIIKYVSACSFYWLVLYMVSLIKVCLFVCLFVTSGPGAKASGYTAAIRLILRPVF
jgi:hypothetical protein